MILLSCKLAAGELINEFFFYFYCARICLHRIYDGDKELRTALIDCEELTRVLWGLVLLRQASILATMRSVAAALFCLVALVAADHGPYHNYKVRIRSLHTG